MFDTSLALQCVRKNIFAYGGTIHQLEKEMFEKYKIKVNTTNLLYAPPACKYSARLGFITVQNLFEGGSTVKAITEAFCVPEGFNNEEAESFLIGYVSSLRSLGGNEKYN